MATKRRRLGARRRHLMISEGVAWWLEHGKPLGIAQAEALGCFEDPAKAAWDASNLYYVRGNARQLRARLREHGFGPVIEGHIANGAPPDDW
jgi:hypothetical protein